MDKLLRLKSQARPRGVNLSKNTKDSWELPKPGKGGGVHWHEIQQMQGQVCMLHSVEEGEGGQGRVRSKGHSESPKETCGPEGELAGRCCH